MGSEPTFTSVSYRPDVHDCELFDSGEPDLDDWLRRSSVPAAAARVAQTFVWVTADQRVGAFYAISAHALTRGEAPSRIGRGVPDPVPAALIGKLALDRAFQRKGLGAVLVADAVRRIVDASRVGPAVRAVVVDASTSRGRLLYRTLGLTPIADHPTRLVARAETLEKALVGSIGHE